VLHTIRRLAYEHALLKLLGRALRLAAPVLRIPGVPGLFVGVDALIRDALFDEPSLETS
jgi:hypothetical protein